jgi:hypothetical protein
MAFQQARRFANQIDTLAAEAHSQRGGGDVKPLLERINVLTRDIQELRELSKGAHHEGAPAPQARDVQHLIDQRVRERIGPIERSKQEMDRRMEETLQAALSAKRLGFWALTIALIVGAGAAGMALYLMP